MLGGFGSMVVFGVPAPGVSFIVVLFFTVAFGMGIVLVTVGAVTFHPTTM